MAADGEAGVRAGRRHLPWQQIPKFTGVTNIDEYTRRLVVFSFFGIFGRQNILDCWGHELRYKSKAFQRISRIDPEKLRSPESIRLLVESLGRTAAENRFYFFEQAIYQVQQKADESNNSYIARQDTFFEELISRSVTLEEVRAYVLLRHSLLQSEDKKRVIMESSGQLKLKYQEIVKAIRLVGSRFFQDLQQRGTAQANRGNERQKVYDTHFTEEDNHDEVYAASVDSDGLDEELVAYYAQQLDKDTIYVAELEDQIIDALQDSELADAYTAYQEARQCEKTRARGYWPSKGRGNTKGQHGKKGKGDPRRRRVLAERIASSACKICGERGHWKRECPRKKASNNSEATHYAQEVIQLEDSEMHPATEFFSQLPEDAEVYVEDTRPTRKRPGLRRAFCHSPEQEFNLSVFV